MLEMIRVRYLISISLVFVAIISSTHGATVQIVASSDLAKPAQYGISKLQEAIASRGIEVVVSDQIEATTTSHVILAGLASNSEIAKRIAEADVAVPKTPESLAIAHTRDTQQQTVVLSNDISVLVLRRGEAQPLRTTVQPR